MAAQPSCVMSPPHYLPVPLADVIQGQGEEVVLGTSEKAATLLVQQQGLIAA